MQGQKTIQQIFQPGDARHLSYLLKISGGRFRDAEEVRKAENLRTVSIEENLLHNPKYEQWKSQLGLFVDDKGLIRCRGRLSNAELPYSPKYPVLLPRSHHITTLIIQRYHEAVRHNGVKQILVQLRSQYWIIKCVVCREVAYFMSPVSQ